MHSNKYRVFFSVYLRKFTCWSPDRVQTYFLETMHFIYGIYTSTYNSVVILKVIILMLWICTARIYAVHNLWWYNLQTTHIPVNLDNARYSESPLPTQNHTRIYQQPSSKQANLWTPGNLFGLRWSINTRVTTWSAGRQCDGHVTPTPMPNSSLLSPMQPWCDSIVNFAVFWPAASQWTLSLYNIKHTFITSISIVLLPKGKLFQYPLHGTRTKLVIYHHQQTLAQIIFPSDNIHHPLSKNWLFWHVQYP